MKIKTITILVFTILLHTTLFAQQIITLATLLKEMTDFDAMAKFPSPSYMLKQASSYDRKSVSPNEPGWFANNDHDQFIREEKKDNHTEYVMMDADGPGAVVRFWLTTVVKQGTLRFYFDNEQKASLAIPAFDLMKAGFNLGPALLNPHSSYEPEGKGGNTLYLPLLYQKHCKITWQYADSANMKTSHYYQVNYRTYALGTRVETFTINGLNAYRKDIDNAENLLWHPVAKAGKKISSASLLEIGKEMSVALPRGANAIHLLNIKLSSPKGNLDEKAWRSIILKISFDGLQTINCPLGDFIGSGYGGKKIKSWYRDLFDSNELASRWVMPYQKEANITIVNESNLPVQLDLSATVSPFTWDVNTMYFHATYKYEENIKDAKWEYDLSKIAKKDSTAPIDWNFATITGKGIYLGNTLSVNNHMHSWYGEGDAKAYVDNETFPSEFGTGLEDYYNTSWAPVVLYQTPFANAPRADSASSAGFNTFTRTRILDAIPFQKAFAFDMEMLSWDGGTIDAATTTYWYGFATASDKTINSSK